MNPSPQFMHALELYDRLAQTHGDQDPKAQAALRVRRSFTTNFTIAPAGK
jgi:hypothetical protein